MIKKLLAETKKLYQQLKTPTTEELYPDFQNFKAYVDTLDKVKIECANRNIYIHSTAIVETDIKNIGDNVKIWAFSHICKDALIGSDVTIGEGVYIGPGVIVSKLCKIQNGAQLFTGVFLEQGVFIGPNVVTTNDIYPSLHGLDTWMEDRFQTTRFKKYCSIGANATIRCGVIIGEESMIGCGSVVLNDIPEYEVHGGNPAKKIRDVEKTSLLFRKMEQQEKSYETTLRYEAGILTYPWVDEAEYVFVNNTANSSCSG